MGIDRPHGGSDRPSEVDRPRETTLWSPRPGWDYSRPLAHPEFTGNNRIAKGYSLETARSRLDNQHGKEYLLAEMRQVELPQKVRDLPHASDVLPGGLERRKPAREKFDGYSMNPDHRDRDGNLTSKHLGWEAIGFNVHDPGERGKAADYMTDLLPSLILHGRVEAVRENPYGTRYTFLNGFIGPNGKHATIASSWILEEKDGCEGLRMTTVHARPHREKENKNGS